MQLYIVFNFSYKLDCKRKHGSLATFLFSINFHDNMWGVILE
jgi:hypothetical protein